MSLPQIPDRLPPHSTESEQGILGCILQDPVSVMPRCRALIPAGDVAFYDIPNRMIYATMLKMDAEGVAIDTITLSQRLKDASELELVGGMAYIASLPGLGALPGLEEYANIVVGKFTRRQVIQEAHQLIEDSYNEGADEALLTQRAVSFLKTRAKRGASDGLFTMGEIEPHYHRRCHELSKIGLRLSSWLPSLNKLRVLIPGNMILILANTGVGKTALLSNIALAALPMPTLFLQLELPKEDLFERLLATKSGMSTQRIENSYIENERIEGNEFHNSRFPNLVISEQPKLTIADIHAKIYGMELKLGMPPGIVLVDYMGLMRGAGQGRYDKFSQIAEDLRILAKETNTIVVVSSQVGRKKEDDNPEVSLHDGKESGSLENSASLVLGAWRNPEKPDEMHLRVLKCNKGGSGTHVVCNYNLDTLKINEQHRSMCGNDDN